jgi:hypothetical protein
MLGEALMARQLQVPFWLVVSVTAVAFVFWILFSAVQTASAAPEETSGSLQILGKGGSVTGACPLKRTNVRGAISGFVARVEVTQTFENSASQKY